MSLREVDRAGILKQLTQGLLTQVQAAEVMHLSDRQVRRLLAQYHKDGPAGLVHGLRGQPGNRRLDVITKDKIVELVKDRYADFKPTFAAEKLAEQHGVTIGREKLRLLMTEAGLWQPKKRKATHRLRRERKAAVGTMEQFDGSPHDWFEGRGPKCCLLASRDDATNNVVAQFAGYEGTLPVFAFWRDYFTKHGKPQSIYLDRHSTYKINSKSALDDPALRSQFERAMEELGIEVIHAYSPQAKGRIENLFGTLQDRLVKELRLAGVSTIPEANRFLREVFLPAYNARFRVKPVSPANLHWPVSPKEDLDQILSVQSERYVNRDFTIRFKSRWLQLEKRQPTLVLPRTRVVVEERLDGSHHLRHGQVYLNWRELASKPEPTTVPVALTANPGLAKARKPAADHPWRNFNIKSKLPAGHF